MRKRTLGSGIAAALVAIAAATQVQIAAAQVKIGATLSTTGPAASLGIPEKNSISLLPRKIGGVEVEFIVLDDATDTSNAVRNTHKLISEERVDLVLGSTVSPTSLAMIDIVAAGKTPMISLAATTAIVAPMDEKKRWVFKLPQNDELMADATVDHMLRNGAKRAAFIGFSDAYGDNWGNEFARAAKKRGLEIVASERFAKTDTSVTGQVLRILAARPDAVLVAGAGTPAALPQIALHERGFRGLAYQTLGSANKDFIRVCGKACEGVVLAAGPVLVADQLPADHPARGPGVAYWQAYEAAYGKGTVTTFGAFVWDVGIMLEAAIPEALKRGKPGTEEFRAALRDAIEGISNLPIAHGVKTHTPTDHSGLDERGRVLVKIVNGEWVFDGK